MAMEASENMLDLKASNVEACRICLSTDIKLYSLQDAHLGSCMDSISAFTKSFDGLPNYVCYECAPILVKCNKLIEKAKTAQATLFKIYSDNEQINKQLIKEQAKSQNLQSTLDSYLLLNYFYIRYDDDNNTSDFIKIESDPTGNINTKLKKEIKEENLDELSDSEILKMFKDMSEKEQDSDGDVEAIEVDIPTVEISDDEKLSDDFISLKPYAVQQNRKVSDLLADSHDVPLYNVRRVKGVAIAKKQKKKKKRKGFLETLTSVHLHENYLKKFFNIDVITPASREIMKYSCKSCPETFQYEDDARDHSIIGCQKPRNSSGNNSAFAIPPSELNSESANLNQPKTWQEWRGGST